MGEMACPTLLGMSDFPVENRAAIELSPRQFRPDAFSHCLKFSQYPMEEAFWESTLGHEEENGFHCGFVRGLYSAFSATYQRRRNESIAANNFSIGLSTRAGRQSLYW